MYHLSLKTNHFQIWQFYNFFGTFSSVANGFLLTGPCQKLQGLLPNCTEMAYFVFKALIFVWNTLLTPKCSAYQGIRTDRPDQPISEGKFTINRDYPAKLIYTLKARISAPFRLKIYFFKKPSNKRHILILHSSWWFWRPIRFPHPQPPPPPPPPPTRDTSGCNLTRDSALRV